MGAFDRDFMTMIQTTSQVVDADGRVNIPGNPNRLWLEVSVSGGAAFRYSFGPLATATLGTTVSATDAAKEFSVFRHGTGVRSAISIHAGAGVTVTWTEGLTAS